MPLIPAVELVSTIAPLAPRSFISPRTEGYEMLQLLGVLGQQRFAQARG
jgi:hypothetical protein